MNKMSEKSRKENLIKQLYALRDGYQMAIDEVFKAYPLDIFPDTSQGERDDVIERYPGFIDRTSAMMGRHIAKVIKERATYFHLEILTGDIVPSEKEYKEITGDNQYLCTRCGHAKRDHPNHKSIVSVSRTLRK